MNTKIIQKCIEELKKDTFSKEYVLGMLETYVEMSGGVSSTQYSIGTPYIPTAPMNYTSSNVDEEIVPDAVRVGPIANLSYNG